MGTYNISGGRQANVGDGAHSNKVDLGDKISGDRISIQLSPEDLPTILTDLRKMREELAKLPKTQQNEEAAARITEAETAAEQGDTSTTIAALQKLKNMGSWVGDFAGKVGAAVVARVIAAQLGF